jgi:cell division septal protein FtsQ
VAGAGGSPGFRVQGVVFRVIWFWVLGFGFLGFGFWVLDFGFWILDLGIKV